MIINSTFYLTSELFAYESLITHLDKKYFIKILSVFHCAIKYSSTRTKILFIKTFNVCTLKIIFDFHFKNVWLLRIH